MADHLVLARSCRPQKFKEVIGQEIAVEAIHHAFRRNRLGSAYLFYGPRGVGKTTMARLLAKLLNCESPVESEPCNDCPSCRSIQSGNSLDVIEIDAASHRGIQYIRELRENAKFQPMNARKKVYIIDEVHMLTMESFNALLKTLEEPPPHILFVLATTELNRVPQTIFSRCQSFHLQRIDLQASISYLSQLCRQQGIEAEEEALFWIARQGDGSLRDSLSFMEQALSYGDGRLKAEKIKKLGGNLGFEIFLDLTGNLFNPDLSASELLAPLQEAFAQGQNLSRFVWEYLDFLRMAIHLQNGIRDPEFLGRPENDLQIVEQRLKQVERGHLQMLFQHIYTLLQKATTLQLYSNYETKVLIEIELLQLKEKLQRPSLSGVLEKLNQLSAALNSTANSPANSPTNSSTDLPATPEPISAATAPPGDHAAGEGVPALGEGAPNIESAPRPPQEGADSANSAKNRPASPIDKSGSSPISPISSVNPLASPSASSLADSYTPEYQIQKEFQGTIIEDPELPNLGATREGNWEEQKDGE